MARERTQLSPVLNAEVAQATGKARPSLIALELPFHILSVLDKSREPLWGYKLIKLLEDRRGVTTRSGPVSIALKWLQSQELIERATSARIRMGPKRDAWKISDKGRTVLQTELVPYFEEICARLKKSIPTSFAADSFKLVGSKSSPPRGAK